MPLSLDTFRVAKFSAVDKTIVSKFDAGAVSPIISTVITVSSILSSLISIDDGVMTLDVLSTSEVCNK
jgi:predicted transcriptional regulator